MKGLVVAALVALGGAASALAQGVLVQVLMPQPARAASPLAGRLALDPSPNFGAWQSLTSADQATGFSERFFHVDYAGQPLVNVSAFAGITKPITQAAAPIRFLAGDVVAVPGSTLDWALGTKWGDAWLPKLKTSVLFAHDLSRLSKTHLFGDFIGIGATYPIGGGSAAP